MSDPRFYVYVVRLRPHTKEDLTAPAGAVYVGSSAHPPATRLAHHRAGGRESSRHVHRYGIRLLPALYEHLNPFRTREAAKRAEQNLARQLRWRGFSVHGSCAPKQPGCVM